MSSDFTDQDRTHRDRTDQDRTHQDRTHQDRDQKGNGFQPPVIQFEEPSHNRLSPVSEPSGGKFE